MWVEKLFERSKIHFIWIRLIHSGDWCILFFFQRRECGFEFYSHIVFCLVKIAIKIKSDIFKVKKHYSELEASIKSKMSIFKSDGFENFCRKYITIMLFPYILLFEYAGYQQVTFTIFFGGFLPLNLTFGIPCALTSIQRKYSLSAFTIVWWIKVERDYLRTFE
jgi:hypothetical protein